MSRVVRFLGLVAAGYAVIVFAAWLLQRRMLYFPETGRPTESQLQASGLAFWPPGQLEPVALVGSHAPASPHGTVVVFHGNAGASWHRLFIAHALEREGWRVVLAEYPGYGWRAGRPSEQTLVEDAQATIRRVHALHGDPILVWGESLGAGVAAAAVADPTLPVCGLVLFTPWDSLAELAQSHYPILPAKLLLRDRYDSLRNLTGTSLPVAIVAAERDAIVPALHARRLYAALSSPKKLWILPDAEHNAFPSHPTAPWWNEVIDWVTRAAGC